MARATSSRQLGEDHDPVISESSLNDKLPTAKPKVKDEK